MRAPPLPCDHVHMAKERGNPYLRWLDRYGGVPLLLSMRLWRRRRSMPPRPLRIGFIKLTAIGDTVLLGAVVEDVRSKFRDAEIVCFFGSENAPIGRMQEGPTEVVAVSPTSPRAVVRELRRRRLDVVIDCGSWSRLEAFCAAASGAFNIGFHTSGQRRHLCQDVSVPHSNRVHELENYRLLVEVLGVASAARPRLDPPGVVDVKQLLPDGPFVLFHPWPSGIQKELKEWPGERWVELSKRMADAGYVVALSGGPGDAPRSRALADSCRVSVVDLAGRLSLPQLVDVISSSSCVVSVNTGTMHLAAAAGAPTVALNGPTSELRWGPVGPRTISVNSSFSGCGYLDLGWEYKGRRPDCMLGISVDDVEEAARHVMGSPAGSVSRGREQ